MSILKISPSIRVEDTLDNGINQENDEQIRAVYMEERETSLRLFCTAARSLLRPTLLVAW